MKTQISFLKMFFSLPVLMMLFSMTDCNPPPPPQPGEGEIHDVSTGNDEKAVPTLDDYPDFVLDEFTDLEPTLNFAQAMESLDFDVHPDWGVDIKAFTCIRSGQSLVVYNPRSSNLDYYASKVFAIYWFKDGKPIRGTNRIECVCKGEFAAIVIHKPSNRGVGFAFYEGRTCIADQAVGKSLIN